MTSPFHAEVAWPAAGVIAVGDGHTVDFLAADTRAPVHTLALGDDRFGHFGPTDGAALFILGWRHVTALDRTLAVRWVAADVAVDGIIFVSLSAGRLHLLAEMDPPGGWVDVELDALTGRELTRASSRRC